jgi:hypothetical protein
MLQRLLPVGVPVAFAILASACAIDAPITPLESPQPALTISPNHWTMVAMGPTSYGGRGEAVLLSGFAVGTQGGIGTGAAVFSPNGTYAPLPPSKAFHTTTHAYDVVQSGSSMLAVGLSTSTVEGQTDNRPAMWTLNGLNTVSVRDLGVPSGLKNAVARAINNSGVVVGYAWYNPGDHRSFRRAADGVHTTIHQPGVLRSAALDVNDDGMVVGTMVMTGNVQRGYRWPVQSGEFNIMQSLQPLAGHHSTHAEAISFTGVIVGYSEGSSGRVAVKWLPGSTAAVDLGLGANTEARDIGPGDKILVRRAIPNGREIVVVTSSGDSVVLPTPQVSYYDAWGINKCGDVVGTGPASSTGNAGNALRWKAQPCVT